MDQIIEKIHCICILPCLQQEAKIDAAKNIDSVIMIYYIHMLHRYPYLSMLHHVEHVMTLGM